MKTLTFYFVNGKKLKSDGRYKEIKINLNGAGLQDIPTEGFEPIECRMEEYDERGFGCGEGFSTVYKKDGKYFERTNFMHFNGHMTGYKEGVYEVYFREIKEVKQ